MDDALVRALSRDLAVLPVTASCLIRRGVRSATEAHRFLHPMLRDLPQPDAIADLPKGAARIARAVVDRERIGVFGDYDVDGLSSAALVYLFLRRLGAQVEVRTAHRFTDGYGFQVADTRAFADAGCTVAVVLDCGSADYEPVALGPQLGMDVVVIDHHRVDRFPDAHAFINPQRPDCGFADRALCTVGLAFYFCAAVRSDLVRLGVSEAQGIDMREYLDLVALGTIADVVPLNWVNRILVSHGLGVMSARPRPGIAALMETARIHTARLSAGHISYQLAPRLNAAGRLGTAMHAFELLVSTVLEDARELAKVLEGLTVQRRDIETAVTRDARDQAAAHVARGGRIVVVRGENWHKGVLGIVAARLADEFQRPAFVVGFDGAVGTGSARGQGQFNLYAGLEAVAHTLLRYGGHHDAAGFSVDARSYDAFVDALEAYAAAHWNHAVDTSLVCDAAVVPGDVSWRLCEEVARLGPFGMGNAEPVFAISDLEVLESRTVGNGHLKLLLRTPSGVVSAFGPQMGDAQADQGAVVDVAAAIVADEWRGQGAVALRLAAPPQPRSAGHGAARGGR